jgi:hypothetical protein
MRIHTNTVFQWDDGMGRYVKVHDEFYEYKGELDLACGASGQQTSTFNQQSALFNQMTSQSATVFGASSSVFQSLINTFAPTLDAGPDQEGLSTGALENLNSGVITNTAQQYKNEKAAVGNAQAAVGGGNVALPSGTNTQTNIELAENAGNQEASQLNQIQQEDYAIGRQNYQNAAAGMEAATNVFNPATGAGSAATGAGAAASTTANQIAQENNSWMSAVSGVLGSVAGAATGGIVGNLTKGLGNPSSNATGTNINNGGYAETTNYTVPDNYTIS